MKLQPGETLQDQGVQLGHVIPVPVAMPLYSLSWQDNGEQTAWMAWVPLSQEERQELQETGNVLKPLLAFGWSGTRAEHFVLEWRYGIIVPDEYGPIYTHAERFTHAFVLASVDLPPGVHQLLPDLKPGQEN